MIGLVKIYRTDDRKIHEEDELTEGVWGQMVNPSEGEGEEYARKLDVDISDLLAALDEEESSRIELEDGYTLILVDIPTTENRMDKEAYTTIPLGIILTQDAIITVCTEDTPVLQSFVLGRVKEFSTKKRLRFVYQILFRIATLYQSALRIIDKKRTEIEERIDGDTEDIDLIDLHALESTLVYFATSLRANAVVLDRLIEMTGIYRDIINGTRELLSSVIDNRLNNVMKYLTAITLVMAVPTIISGFFGMNVSVPLAQTAHAFSIISVATVLICVVLFVIFKKNRML